MSSNYVVARDTRYAKLYLQEKGTFSVGTPDESQYVYWTANVRDAQSFETAKRARAMCGKLDEDGLLVMKRP